MPKLSDTKIRSAKPKERPFKLYDEEGLFLIVTPSGGRWWRQRYYWHAKEQLLSLGTYPEIDLATARDRRDAVRTQVKLGVNPSADRQEQKASSRSDHSYQAVSLEWLEHMTKFRKWTEGHIDRVKRRQEVHFFPWLGKKQVNEVTDDEVLACVLRVSDRGLLDTAYRSRAEVDAIFRYAKKRKMVKVNPAADLRGADVLPQHKVQHHSAITDPAQFGALLGAIDQYPGGFTVRCALRFQALVFVRPGELRLARWEEFDLAAGEWRIPAERMKMREHHVVPLSRQALAVLKALQPLTGADGQGFVFPQVRNASRPISNNTLNAALRTLGYTKQQASAHGFRSTASTLLNESGDWNSDAIERQLAHGERNEVRGAYNKAQHLPERRRMMQAWADYLDTLKGRQAAVRPAKAVGQRYKQRLAQLEAIADRVDSIPADRAESVRGELRHMTQLELDKGWPEPEVWGKKSPRKIVRKAARRYRGERANEDKAAIVRRAVVRAAGKRLQDGTSALALAKYVEFKLVLPAGIKRPGVRALRRIVTQLRG